MPALTVRGVSVDYSPFTIVALPGEQLVIAKGAGQEGQLLIVDSRGKPLGKSMGAGWLINVPEQPGHSLLEASLDDGQTMEINLFVTVPATEVRDDYLNGYRLGPSPPGHPAHPELYQQPEGYIEVSNDMLDLRLSPHFRLGQFLCKQEGGFPKYLVLEESLLVMLEGLLGAVREAGYPAETFGVISAYRTPWYNHKIGNVPNSRHVYGDAMDLFVDMDGDGSMDDLNDDGASNREDVVLLADIATKYMAGQDNPALIGGVGRYGRNSRHGGFVHVDTRGYHARW